MRTEYIDKQKAIDELCNVDEYNAASIAAIRGMNPAHVKLIIEGNWLPDNRPDGGFWVCSNCKFPSEAFAADKLYKYCPNCGCAMCGE